MSGKISQSNFASEIFNPDLLGERAEFVDAACLFVLIFGTQREISEFFIAYAEHAWECGTGGLFRRTVQSEVCESALATAFPDRFDGRGRAVDENVAALYKCPRNDPPPSDDFMPAGRDDEAAIAEFNRKRAEYQNRRRQELEKIKLKRRLIRSEIDPMVAQAVKLQTEKYQNKSLAEIYGIIRQKQIEN